MPLKVLLSRSVSWVLPALIRFKLPLMLPLKSRAVVCKIMKSTAAPPALLVMSPPVPGRVEVLPDDARLPMIWVLPFKSNVAPGFTLKSLARTVPDGLLIVAGSMNRYTIGFIEGAFAPNCRVPRLSAVVPVKELSNEPPRIRVPSPLLVNPPLVEETPPKETLEVSTTPGPAVCTINSRLLPAFR